MFQLGPASMENRHQIGIKVKVYVMANGEGGRNPEETTCSVLGGWGGLPKHMSDQRNPGDQWTEFMSPVSHRSRA